MSQICLEWLGHSCFKVTCAGYAVLLDPYADGSVPGLGKLRPEADEVICSHGHSDHNAGQVVRLRTRHPADPFTVLSLDSFHDHHHGARRGPNRITVLEAEGLRIAHMGDVGCMPTPEQLTVLSGLDAVLIPVGGHFTLPPEECRSLLETLHPTVTVPMHYRGTDFGYPVIGTLEEFLRPEDNVVCYPGNTLELVPGMTRQVAVLRCK